jgi:hypothetical protein
MASEVAAAVSTEHRESSAEQSDASLADDQVVTSMEVTSDQDASGDEENPSGETGDRGIASDNGGHVKIGAEATLASMSYDFGQSKLTRAHITSLENSARYCSKGFARSPGVESVPIPKENEAVVFEDFFVAGLHIPPHSILLEILHKF